MHTLQEKQQSLERKRRQEKYRDELKKLSEFKKENEKCDQQNNNFENNLMRNVWETQNQMHRKLQHDEKTLKQVLSQHYQDQVQLLNKAKHNEFQSQRSDEQMMLYRN
jgi:hypothetical protein